MKKLQTLVIKLDVQLKNELRIANRVKKIRFKSLERNIIALDNASKGSESVKGLMHWNDVELIILKSKLKMPQHELMNSKELISAYEERDLFSLEHGRFQEINS